MGPRSLTLHLLGAQIQLKPKAPPKTGGELEIRSIVTKHRHVDVLNTQ